jgi:hypothetical protein
VCGGLCGVCGVWVVCWVLCVVCCVLCVVCCVLCCVLCVVCLCLLCRSLVNVVSVRVELVSLAFRAARCFSSPNDSMLRVCPKPQNSQRTSSRNADQTQFNKHNKQQGPARPSLSLQTRPKQKRTWRPPRCPGQSFSKWTKLCVASSSSALLQKRLGLRPQSVHSADGTLKAGQSVCVLGEGAVLCLGVWRKARRLVGEGWSADFGGCRGDEGRVHQAADGTGDHRPR